MSLEEKRKQAHIWASQFDEPYWPLFEQIAAVQEELGGLNRELLRGFGSQKRKSVEDGNDIGMEVTDIIFNLLCICNNLEVKHGVRMDLDDIWKMKLDKLYGRDSDRYEKKE